MPNIVIAGAQWGDEGKGKIVDLLTDRVQVVARYNGGHNAGHTIRVGEARFILHLIPSGILHPGILCVMGAGMVIDPWALEKEVAELRERGVSIEDNLVLSDRAHLILPHHRALEALTEELRGAQKIGTTLRGIGPAYEDKAGRRGVRMVDLLRPESLPARLQEARRHFEQVFRGAGRTPEVDWDRLVEDLAAFGRRLRPWIQDASLVLHRQLVAGYSVLFEGAQATLLDVDHGTYPFVTSSSAIAGGGPTGLGVAPTRVDGAIGIAKAYTTRVGAGPLPSEIGGPPGGPDPREGTGVRRLHGPPAALRLVRLGGGAVLGAGERVRQPCPHKAGRPGRAARGADLQGLLVRRADGHGVPRGPRPAGVV